MQKPLIQKKSIKVKGAIELLVGLSVDANTPVAIKFYGENISGSLFKCLAFLESKDDSLDVAIIKVETGFIEHYCPLKKIKDKCVDDKQAHWLWTAHKAAPLIDREDFVELFNANYGETSFVPWMKELFESKSELLKGWHKRACK